MATIEADELSPVVSTNDVVSSSNRDDFAHHITVIERSVADDGVQFATIAPHDANGQPVRVRMAADSTREDFWCWLADQRCASFDSVETRYCAFFNVGERIRRLRLLHYLYLHGAVLTCIGVLSASDVDDFGKSAQWYVCGTDEAHECSLAIALDLVKSAHVARMNLCIAKRLLLPVLQIAFDFGVIKNLERTIGQMQVLLLASNAQSIVRDMGWQDKRLDCLWSILQEIFWATRPELFATDDASLSIAALCLFEPIRRRTYERKPDLAIESLTRYYLCDSDVLTESNRRSTTQRLSNNHATLSGARAFIMQDIGLSLSRSTICRLLARRRDE